MELLLNGLKTPICKARVFVIIISIASILTLHCWWIVSVGLHICLEHMYKLVQLYTNAQKVKVVLYHTSIVALNKPP